MNYKPEDLRVFLLPSNDGDPMGSQFDTKEEALQEAWQKCARRGLVSSSAKVDPREWDYVQVIPYKEYHQYQMGNNGGQAWRHRTTGYTIPDNAILEEATGHMWHRTKKRNLFVHPTSPLLTLLP